MGVLLVFLGEKRFPLGIGIPNPEDPNVMEMDSTNSLGGLLE